jgi:hypothetical protein
VLMAHADSNFFQPVGRIMNRFSKGMLRDQIYCA